MEEQEKPFLIHESAMTYRRDDISGPKYLMRGPRLDFGLVVLTPGEDYQTHYHRTIEEDFFTLEGNIDIYVDGHFFATLKPGDLIHLPPMCPHYLINRGASPWKAVLVKAGFSPGDRVNINWLPGDPAVTIT